MEGFVKSPIIWPYQVYAVSILISPQVALFYSFATKCKTTTNYYANFTIGPRDKACDETLHEGGQEDGAKVSLIFKIKQSIPSCLQLILLQILSRECLRCGARALEP